MWLQTQVVPMTEAESSHQSWTATIVLWLAVLALLVLSAAVTAIMISLSGVSL